MTDNNTVGWTGFRWVNPVPCVACKRNVTAGIVNVLTLRKGALPESFRALCWACWYSIPATSDNWTADAANITTNQAATGEPLE